MAASEIINAMMRFTEHDNLIHLIPDIYTTNQVPINAVELCGPHFVSKIRESVRFYGLLFLYVTLTDQCIVSTERGANSTATTPGYSFSELII